jgi:hypothetical protein
MDISLSLTSIKKFIFNLLRRYHIIIFVIFVAGGLVVIVFMLNSIILRSSDPDGYTASSNNSTFDQATIDRIKQLRTSGENDAPLDLSKGRTNPFIE